MQISVIPEPQYADVKQEESFEIDTATRIVADAKARAAAELFATIVRGATGYELPLGSEPTGTNEIIFTVDASADYRGGTGNPEAYSIAVRPTAVTVRGASAHGVFNATQTLRQLLPAAIEATDVLAFWTIPAVSIVDWPEFSYRGLMIDVARSFLTVKEMKQIIDLATLAKVSKLHLHLSDDQGWRIEITNEGRAADDPIDYSVLTEISGATAMTERGYENEPGRTGFYTQDDYSELVAYAAERHITVIPEIDLPGHTIGALVAIPELNTAGSSHEGTAEQPLAQPDGTAEVGHSYLDPHSEHTYAFARHVLSQIAAITPGEYLHIGGDEPLKMTKRYGTEVYLECVAKIAQIVREVGKKPAGWNELAQAQAGPDAMVQFWQGESDHTVEAARAGAKIVLSRGESAYLDQKYHPDFPVGLDWACKGDCDFPLYYSWEPTELVPELTREQIAGVEAPLWSETLRGVSQIFLMMFPRLFATAELGWSNPSSRSLEGFTARIAHVAPRLLFAGGNFYTGEKAPWAPVVAGFQARQIGGPVRVARVAAPGEQMPEVTVEVDGQEVAATLEVVQNRTPIHAGPVYDVFVSVTSGDGVVRVGQASAPVRIS